MSKRTPYQRLTEAQQTYIVVRCAQFASPTTVERELLERWGVKFPRDKVEYYDPTKGRSRRGKLAKKWVALFWEARRLHLQHQAGAVTPAPMVRTSASDAAVLATVLREMHAALGRILDQLPPPENPLGLHVCTPPNGSPPAMTSADDPAPMPLESSR